jgi:hypothetical protein
MGQGRDVASGEPPHRLHLPVGHRREPVPAVAEDADQAARLPHLDVTRLVHDVVQEEVAGEHRHADETTGAGAP